MKMLPGWKAIASVTPGGKPYFYLRSLTEYHGYRRVAWNRARQLYVASVDQKYGDPRIIGDYPTILDGMRAADAVVVQP